MTRCQSPDGDALLRWQIHAVAFRDPERFVKLVHVLDWQYGSHLSRRMGIGLDLVAKRFFVNLHSPDGRVRDEECLLRGQAVEISDDWAGNRCGQGLGDWCGIERIIAGVAVSGDSGVVMGLATASESPCAER